MAKHFFQEFETYEAIADLTRVGRWVVYVGLGATIDRTDVNWEQLIHALLMRHEDETGASPADVRRWIEKQGPQRAATTVEALFRRRNGGNWEEAVAESIRAILYGPRQNMAGSLLAALAEWAFAIAAKGGSVVFITPNYDDYLFDLVAGYQAADSRDWTAGVKVNDLVVITSKKKRVPERWSEPRSITCVHVHGYVPRAGKPKGTPAVGEVTYLKTSQVTANLLGDVLDGSNLLVVGSSLSDGPLVNALILDREKKDRVGVSYVIQPFQGSEWRDPESGLLVAGVHALNAARVEALGLKTLQPEYYGQVSQVLFEAADSVHWGTEAELVDEQSPLRYDKRVATWWHEWCAKHRNAASQEAHHKALAALLPRVRKDLEASRGEGLKIEIWTRWEPNSERQLALWATSNGSWIDYTIQRRDELSLNSRLMAVQVFCAGSPKLLTEEEGVDSRWRTYFGYPIWRFGEKGRFIAAVIIVASMYPAATADARVPSRARKKSSLTDTNLERIQKLHILFDAAGDLILDPATSADELAGKVAGIL